MAAETGTKRNGSRWRSLLSENAEVERRDGAGMEEIGKVYRDPKTGKTYIVDKGEDGYEEDE